MTGTTFIIVLASGLAEALSPPGYPQASCVRRIRRRTWGTFDEDKSVLGTLGNKF